MKINILFAAAFAFSLGLSAQQGDGGLPKSFKDKLSFTSVDKVVFQEPNIEALKAEDANKDPLKNSPWRFGYNNVTALNMQNSGTWFDLPNGGKIWLLTIKCNNALTVNLTLDKVEIPAGNEMYIYNSKKDFILGKFTAYHLYEGELGAELIPGNTAIVEYYIPASNINLNASLNINTVTHGYRTADEFQEKAFGSSGSCNMNVNCPDGLPYTNERNAALMLVSGSNGFCSGSLINNTQNDGKPYVLTANHCYSSPASWIFRFNWQSATCANPGSSPSTTQSLSGGVLRARRTPSDFCLVEITGGLVSGTVPLAYNPYFPGWDNTGVNPTSTVCVHHPAGDIKKISFDDAGAFPVQAMGSTEANSSWEVEWDRNTTTEGGSSGSPLFDQTGRIIGQLWGGGASCSNLSSPDYYGRVFNSWEPAGSNSTNQLKFWLDPNTTGAGFIDGYDPSGAIPVANDASLTNPENVTGTVCDNQVSPTIKITNLGSATLTSATITYGYNGLFNQTYNFTGSLAQYQSQVIPLNTAVPANGANVFNALVSNPNGVTDENVSNNNATSNFNFNPNGVQVDLNLTIDCYGTETSWELRDDVTNALIQTGGPYSDNAAGLNVVNFCLVDNKCYKFIINDSYGDGMTSNSCASGSYTINDTSGAVLAELLMANANFGSQLIKTFCVNYDVSGIKETTTELITVYPNPAKDVLFFNSDSQILEIEIYSISGQLIIAQQPNLNNGKIDISKLNIGSYVVKLQSENGVQIKKIVVE